MKPVISDGFKPCCHALDAFAIAWPDQTGNIGRALPLPHLVSRTVKIRRKPPLKVRFRNPSIASLHKSQLLMNHAINAIRFSKITLPSK